jgi:hypothetical protein
MCLNWEKRLKLLCRVFACCNDPDQILLPVLIFKRVNKKQEFDDGSPQRSDVYMKLKLLYISTDPFSKSFIEYFLLTHHFREGHCTLNGYKPQCSSALLIQTTVENNVLSFVHQVTVLTSYR